MRPRGDIHDDRGRMERALAVFADVKRSEAAQALLMLTNLFLLLVGYYILKTVREPLILATGGAELKSYAAAGQAVILMGFIPLYGWLASRVDRLKLIVIVLSFFIANVELFHFAGLARVPYVGVVFYIWVGIFSLAAIAQFWSFANDIYSQEAGARLFPLIAIGATAGSPIGAQIAKKLFEGGVDPFNMLHLTAAILLAHLGLYWVVSSMGAGKITTRTIEAARLSGPDGFQLVLRNPYLRWAALVFVLLNVVNTNGEYIVGSLAVQAAKGAAASDPTVKIGAYIGTFYGEYFFYVNVLAVLLQAFLVSRVVRYFGFRGVMLALPFVALGTYGFVAAGAGFALTRWLKTAENSTDYSVMNTGRQMLWLPTTRDEKYKGKQAIDTFFTRAGDVLSAGVIYAGTTWLGVGVSGFAAINVIVIVLWIGAIAVMLKKHGVLTGEYQGATGRSLSPEEWAVA
jgi:AAA family ATP:ADP antiporter